MLHTTTRLMVLTWLAGIRQRVGYARRMGWLLTRPVPYTKRWGTRHELDYTLDLLRVIGIPAGDRRLEIAWQPEARAVVEHWLAQAGVSAEDRVVVLHPGASCPSKRWPVSQFAEVASRLNALAGAPGRAGVRVVVVAGPGDEHLAHAVRRGSRSPALVPDRPLPLAALSWLLRRADCLVSNDSGPVHVACAAGTPVVAIFGRWGRGLSPTRWGPTGPGSVVLHHDVGCRPCLAHRCQIGFPCLAAVTVDEVVAAARQAIDARAGDR